MTSVRRFVRYGAVSVISTCVGLAVLGALVAVRAMPPGWANVVATAVGTVPSFELNRRWVWHKHGRRSLTTEVAPFWVLSFTGLALSTVAVGVATGWADSAHLGDTARTAVAEGAHLAGFGLLWFAQFLVLDRFLFGRRRAVLVDSRS
jgi:putative flippase GtrA